MPLKLSIKSTTKVLNTCANNDNNINNILLFYNITTAKRLSLKHLRSGVISLGDVTRKPTDTTPTETSRISRDSYRRKVGASINRYGFIKLGSTTLLPLAFRKGSDPNSEEEILFGTV